MIVVIDGYNLIKQILGSSRVSHAQRDKFVDELVSYFRKRHLSGVIVFDGGSFSYPYITKQGHIQIIFSGYKEKADAIIMRFIDDHLEYELLVVSSDHEIQQYTQNKKKITLAVDEFYYRYVQKIPEEAPTVKTDLHKIIHDAPPELDELMRESTNHIPEKDDDISPNTRQRSLRRTSKKERKQNRVLRKL